MSTGKRNILLVEDDPNHLALLTRAFRSVGLPGPAHAASDGDEPVPYLLYRLQLHEPPPTH